MAGVTHPTHENLALIDSPSDQSIREELIFLGTGTSHGIPVIGCGCPVCTSTDPKDRRSRCSVVLGLPEGVLLVDSPPDLRTQLLREGIGTVHAVLYTHEHADHLFGLDDLRIFPQYLGHDLPVYCDETVEDRIRRVFDYAFDPITRQFPAGGIPRLVFRRVHDEPFEVLGTRVIPFPMRHGRYPVLGFRFGNVAYCTDTNGIPPASMALLEGLEVLVLDCLRRRPHPTHFSLDEAIEVARRLAPKRTIFTHICHDLGHEATNAILPPGMELAYDGMRVGLGS
jgi:phosphoribosyl 1,2-cyclic phosphate phosphodiesterase